MAGYEETFARYYDALTADVDYRGHGAYLKSLAEQYGGRFRLVLDLACGTGSLAVELARLGAEVIGVDGSQEMLAQAMNKSFGLAPPILYLCQDMEELDLYGTVDTTLCTLDSLNHLPGKEALRRTLHRVWLFTEPGGLFLFDMNTPEKHIRRLNGSTYLRETEEVCCIWQNTLDPQDNSVGIELDFFVAPPQGGDSGPAGGGRVPAAGSPGGLHRRSPFAGGGADYLHRQEGMKDGETYPGHFGKRHGCLLRPGFHRYGGDAGAVS